MADTLVIIATYNEAENLPKLLDEVFRCAPQVDILVVDDNSPDGTGRWCDERRQSEPRLHCLHRPGKKGLGAALLAGMRYAIDHHYRFAITMDADFSHPPAAIPSLLAAVYGNASVGASVPVDCAIGSRYVPGGSIVGWPLTRRLMSRAVNAYTRFVLGLRPKDCSGGFRCYRVQTLAKLDFARIRSRGYSFEEEILYRLHRLGAQWVEVPYEFVDRAAGTSKINLHEALMAVWIIFRLRLEAFFEQEPGS